MFILEKFPPTILPHSVSETFLHSLSPQMAAAHSSSDQNPNIGSSNQAPPSSSSSAPSLSLVPSAEQTSLSDSEFLIRPEVLRRRVHNLRQLSRCYRHHYWSLVEDLRVQCRDYKFKYGLDPYEEEDSTVEGETERNDLVEGSGETNNDDNMIGDDNELGLGLGGCVDVENPICAFMGCNLKAMALTRFCYLHILSDPNQQLYKPCEFVIKSALAGPITCGKPILRTMSPSLCAFHLQKTQRNIAEALKEAGVSASLSNKVAPRFDVLVVEFVRQIQAKRRRARERNVGNVVSKEGTHG